MDRAEHGGRIGSGPGEKSILLVKRRKRLWLVAGLLGACLSPDLHAGGGCVVPPNETCGGQILFKTDDLPFEDSGILGCVNDVIDKPYWDIFYRYECTISREHTFEMCDSDGDTYIRIYINGCGWTDGDGAVGITDFLILLANWG